MDLAIQILSYAVGIPLQILTVTALLRGAWREYPLVFSYVVTLFLVTVTETPFAFEYIRARQDPQMYVRMYWINEGILQVLILSVVVGFIYSATAKLQPRRTIRFFLLAGAILFAGISFLVHYISPFEWRTLGMWMAPWARDLKVCSTFLDLALWAMLIASRHKDRLLLLLTGAMGIYFTGEAIGSSISTMSASGRSGTVSLVGSTITVIANNVFLYLWWQAFRRLPVKRKQLA